MKSIAIVTALVSFVVGCGTASEDTSVEEFTTSSSSSALSIFECREMLNNTHPISTVRTLEIVSDLAVQSGGASTGIEAIATNSDTQWAPFTTCVGVFNGGITSDPTTGGTLQLGAIYTPAQFPSATRMSVKVNPGGLAPGAYWLRTVTRLQNGTNDVAEGTLLVH